MTSIVAIVGDVLVQNGPKSLNRIEMWAIWRQLDQVDTAASSCQKSPDIRPFVVGGIVPDHVYDALVGVALLDFGEQLRGTDPIHRSGLDKGCIEGFEVHSAMNVYTTAPSCAENRGV